MRAIDLEARVITAVDRIRAGQSAEHDLIECKRDWPQDKKVRQLAGSLNRAGGDPVIYIIGIDEETTEVHDISGTDVADWWNQITPKFDQMPPEMIRHITVPVGEDGQHVVAIAFASDRAPYVVKTGSANPSLEVPMREGTGTRTARRDELLRLLIPTVSVPQAVTLSAELYVEFYPPVPERKNESGNTVSAQKRDHHVIGRLRVYFEHNGKDLVTLPAHGMRGRVILDGMVPYNLKVRPAREITKLGGSRDLTMAPPGDGVSLSAPKAVSFDIEFPELSTDNIFDFESAESVAYEFEMDVLHATRPLRLNVPLEPTEVDREHTNPEYQRIIGQWKFAHPGLGMDG